MEKRRQNKLSIPSERNSPKASLFFYHFKKKPRAGSMAVESIVSMIEIFIRIVYFLNISFHHRILSFLRLYFDDSLNGNYGNFIVLFINFQLTSVSFMDRMI